MKKFIKSARGISVIFLFAVFFSSLADAKGPHVVIMGGGVSGMSAAQELGERGFEVTVLETKSTPGGKARSIGKPSTGVDGRKDLPGEHGFRFFPGFYKHVTDSMSRIPFENNPHGVFDNLVEVPRMHIAREGQPKVTLPTSLPKSVEDIRDVFNLLLNGKDMYISPSELSYFLSRLMYFLTSCDERRIQEYEDISWFDFLDAPHKSENYRKYFAIGLTRCLVATKAEIASLRTVATILIQLLLNEMGRGEHMDRVLNGPTNEVWIEPWLKYLKSLGVDYHLNASVESIQFNSEQNRIESIQVRENGVVRSVSGDYYISAVPAEKAAPLMNDAMVQADPQLGLIKKLKTEWMVGIQFFLRKDLPIARAHSIYFDSPWALTSISQHQFWKDIDLSH